MRPARVPDPALGRIAVMADPDVSPDVFQLVGANHVVAVGDHLQDQQVLAVGEDEGSRFAGGRVKGPVETIAILEDDLILHVDQDIMVQE